MVDYLAINTKAKSTPKHLLLYTDVINKSTGFQSIVEKEIVVWSIITRNSLKYKSRDMGYR